MARPSIEDGSNAYTRVLRGCSGNESRDHGPLSSIQLYPADCRRILDVITAAESAAKGRGKNAVVLREMLRRLQGGT